MFELRDYQEDVIVKVRMALRRHRRVLLQLPTGGGKTMIAAKMVGTSKAKGLRSFFNCHRDFLVDQSTKSFFKVGIDHAFVANGWQWQPHHPVQICSVPTLRNRLEKIKKPNIIFWDEAHHLGAASWQAIMEWAPDAYHVGLSASPERLDGKGLDGFFDELVLGPTVRSLIDKGHLSDYTLYAPHTPNLLNAKTKAGDFDKSDVDAELDTKKVYGDLLRHYKQHAAGKRAVYFAVSIRRSQDIADTFTLGGFPFAHLDASSSSADRIDAARALANGTLAGISNVDLFGEGFDLAAQAGVDVTIDCIGEVRPTKSLAMHIQHIGRALRPKKDGSKAIILDHAGNWMRHGLPDEDHQWKLQGKKAREAASGKSRKMTVRNGIVFAERDVEMVEEDLKQIDADAIRASKRKEEWECQTIEDFISLGRTRGYSHPERWAQHRMEARMKRIDERERMKFQQSMQIARQRDLV